MTNSKVNGQSAKTDKGAVLDSKWPHSTDWHLLVKIPGLESELKRVSLISNKLVIGWGEGDFILFLFIHFLRLGFSV